jgi:hypothetical protein
MKKNVGGMDRILRIVIGIVLIGYAVAGPEFGLDTGYNVWGWIGVVPLGTALVSFCPLYPILGISTCKTSPS